SAAGVQDRCRGARRPPRSGGLPGSWTPHGFGESHLEDDRRLELGRGRCGVKEWSHGERDDVGVGGAGEGGEGGGGVAPQRLGGEAWVSELGGKLLLNGRVSDANPTYLSGEYPAGTRLGKWVLRDWKGEEVQLKATIPARCFRTVYHEDAAGQLGWPAAWPSV